MSVNHNKGGPDRARPCEFIQLVQMDPFVVTFYRPFILKPFVLQFLYFF